MIRLVKYITLLFKTGPECFQCRRGRHGRLSGNSEVFDHLRDLTPSEFSLLKVLMAHPDRVFTRSELLDKVQGYQFEGYDRTIDTHIKNLRKKIAERLPDRDILLTVYGVGYKLTVSPYENTLPTTRK